jgi:O-antigen/teichoic acid export membrane protein
VFTPLIGVFEDAHSRGDKMAIAKLLLKLFGLLVGITALAMLAVLLLGEFAMVLVFGEEIREYVYLLYPTIIASALTALVWLLGMLLVVMRDTKTLLIGAICGFAVSLLIAIFTIRESIYTGTNASIILGFALISVIYIIKFLVFFFKRSEQRSETNDGN